MNSIPPLLQRLWVKLFGYKLHPNPPKNICSVTGIIVPEKDSLNAELCHDPLLEESKNQVIPGTKRYARKDKGQQIPGKEWHIHVYADSRKGDCLYAINADSTPHDGSKVYIGPEDCKYLRSKGIEIPDDGYLLEWKELDQGKHLIE